MAKEEMVRKCWRIPAQYAKAIELYATYLGVPESTVVTLALDIFYLNDKVYKRFVEEVRRWLSSPARKNEA